MDEEKRQKYEYLINELLDLDARIALIKNKSLRSADFDPILKFNLCQMAGGMTQGLGAFYLHIHHMLNPDSDSRNPMGGDDYPNSPEM